MPPQKERSPEIAQRRRRAYVQQRIPILREEMQKLVEETKGLSEKVSSAGDAKSDESKASRKRLVYLTEHREVLRKELQSLVDEQKSTAPRAAPAT